MNRYIVKRARNGYMVFENCGIRCTRYICSCDTQGFAELIAKLLNEWYDKCVWDDSGATDRDLGVTEDNDV